MIKYTTAEVTFREIPDEITLCINISGCPIKCPDCHSKELWGDIGRELTPEVLQELIEANKGISCVCFMGGDADPTEINRLALAVKLFSDKKVAWYSGKSEIPSGIRLSNFNYIKLGPYFKEFGGLDSPLTNQTLFKITDITDKFNGKK